MTRNVFLHFTVGILIQMLVAAVSGGCSPVPAPEQRERYAVERGIVTFHISGAHTGSATYYFEDWGNREAMYLDYAATAAAPGARSLFAVISDDEGGHYLVDLAGGTAARVAAAAGMPLPGDLGGAWLGGAGEGLLESIGARGEVRKVLLFQCTEWRVAGGSSCIWDRLPLITVLGKAPRSTTIAASGVRLGAEPPAQKLALPAGIAVGGG